jgi:carbon storage regulator
LEDGPVLVLTRKPNERIVIAGEIAVQILDVIGGRVRLGIEAPADIPIWREEVAAGREWEECAAGPVRKSR